MKIYDWDIESRERNSEIAAFSHAPNAEVD